MAIWYNVNNMLAPQAYLQIAAGRGAGAALGLVAVLVVGLCTLFSYVAVEQRRKKLGIEQVN